MFRRLLCWIFGHKHAVEVCREDGVFPLSACSRCRHEPDNEIAKQWRQPITLPDEIWDETTCDITKGRDAMT